MNATSKQGAAPRSKLLSILRRRLGVACASLLVVGVLFAQAQLSAWEEARLAWQRGDAGSAAAALEDHPAAQRDPIEPRFAYDYGLSGLAAGQRGRLDAALRGLRASGDLRAEGRAEFLLGARTHQDALGSAERARGGIGGPAAFDGAIAQARRAASHYARAATAFDDFGPARRNLERVLRLIPRLEAERDAAREAAGEPPAPPRPQESPEGAEAKAQARPPAEEREEEGRSESQPPPPPEAGRLAQRELRETLKALEAALKARDRDREARRRALSERTPGDW